MADDIEDEIRSNAVGPAEAHGDEGSVRQHPLKDQIEADKYLASRTGAALPHRGLRFAKMVPPGV